jgi:hypothetical protein
MRKILGTIILTALLAAVAGCSGKDGGVSTLDLTDDGTAAGGTGGGGTGGGGTGGGGATGTQTYTATLLNMQVQQKGGSGSVAVGGFPVQGATVTGP